MNRATAAAPASIRDLLRTANQLRWDLPENFHDQLVEGVYAESARIAERNVEQGARSPRLAWEQRLDRLLTNRWTGVPVMIGVLTLVLWITIEGANLPSGMLGSLLLETVHPWLKGWAASVGVWPWLDGILIDGVYLTTAWVVTVMLPPMAIFFPLFTILEDFGYLPRVAFNLDRMFQRAGAHGKQALTMCMGLGCNAAGVIATRIIDSPRERLIAIITNNFALCNGRWPTQILIATVFLGALAPAGFSGFAAALGVVSIALLGVGLTFLSSWGLSRTVLKGEASTFSLELPPYRPPRILRTLYTSLIDRTIFVLWRAVVFALPAGAAIWLVSNVRIAGQPLAEYLIHALNPIGLGLGLNGVILLAYLVAIPANEIVIPTILMLTVLTTGVSGVGEQGAGVMFEAEGPALANLLQVGGWTTLTAICLMLFSLCHNPCSTTLYTIYKETRSGKWTLVSALLPIVFGFVVCGVVAFVWRLVAGGP
jgi:ferrous iron transport protein B